MFDDTVIEMYCAGVVCDLMKDGPGLYDLMGHTDEEVQAILDLLESGWGLGASIITDSDGVQWLSVP